MAQAKEEQQVPADSSSTNEVPKRWGFRRSTIAKREFMEEVGNLDVSSVLAPRRGARQARGRGRGRGKGKEAGETRPDSPALKRGRGGKKRAPANPSPVPSPVPLGTHTTTDFDGSNAVDTGTTQQKTANSTANSAAKSQSYTELQAPSDIEASSEAPLSDQTEDSDDLTLRQLQERARNRRRLEEASTLLVTDLNLNTNTANKGVEEAHEQEQCLQSEQNTDNVRVQGGASSSSIQRSEKSLDTSVKDQKLFREFRRNEVEEEAMQSEDSEKPLNDSSEESDPNAIYCICRQTHNNRFMICCDRCQEWFHGDCVGISEARGRLLEKNGEDYICPTCSPCQSPVDFLKQPVLSRAAFSSSSESLFSSSAGEDRPSEDEGIRGKIRKATTHNTKRKFKIFQPVKVEAAVLRCEKEDEVKEKQTSSEEKAAAPKCIGPGCDNDALPESVYCGHQCIIRHAAVTMQTIVEPKPQPQLQAKPAPKPVPEIQKKTFLEKLFKRKVVEKPVEKPVKEEECSKKEVVVTSPMEEPVAAPLSTDPKPRAAGAQESTAIAPSVFYKSIKEEKEYVENKAELKEDAPQRDPPNPPAASEVPEKEEKTRQPDEINAPTPPPKKPVSNQLTSRAKKTMPSSPRLAGLRQLQSEPSQLKKSTVPVEEKPTQNKEPATTQQTQTPSASIVPEIRVLPVTPAPVAPSRPLQAHPNMQMRQNIRRSLTEILSKRVSESDDLEMSESDVGRLAVNIEREMFNMYYTTDSKYKNKYRTLLLSLKDPRNKGLFYQVMKGYITPFKLTRLSQEELQGGQNIAAYPLPLKEDLSPACGNMEKPVSVCEKNVVKSESTASSSEEKATASQTRHAQPRKASTAVSDIISSMLKDTTSEHKAHLFDLKCKICTGQVSADEDPDSKAFNKEELKEKEAEKPNRVIQMFDKKPPADVPEEADPVMESPASPTAEDSSIETVSSEFSPMVIPEVSVVSITRRDPRRAAYCSAPSPSVAHPPAQAPPSAQNLHLTLAPPPAKAEASTQPVMPAEKEKVEETKTVQPLPLPPPLLPSMPKSILMKPSAPSLPRFYNVSGSNTRLAGSHIPGENETSQFLSKQNTVWKGFLNMLNVAKFVTKAYLISGSASAELLKKDLPDTIHIGGRILPQTVWDYVEKVKTSVTKELFLIRFHPATDEEEVAYVSLFSYFNSRRRFGVISNICNSIKDLYLIPLCAQESVPSLLLPLEGPGLEEQHPNLLLGLAICQKLKRPGVPAPEFDEKRPRLLVPLDSQGMSLPTQPAVPDVKLDGSEPYDPYIPISTTPPGSPPAGGSPDSSSSSSSSLTGPSAISSILSVVNPPSSGSADIAKTASLSLVTPSGADISSSNTPLQTILNTLFGKKNQDSDLTENKSEPSSSRVKGPSISSPSNIDPIVQHYQQNPQDSPVEKIELEDDDRPYDPEEEYDPVVEYQKYPVVSTLKPTKSSKPNTSTSATNEDDCGGGDNDRPYDPEEEYYLGSKVDTVSSIDAKNFSEIEPPVNVSEIKNDIAYDPEDETVFEEMQTYLADTNMSSTTQCGTAPPVSLSEQQKLLEELNRQIEEQKRQLEEQEEALRLQRAAVGVSMAHFSVSDALMSPPPSFGREPEEPTVKVAAVPTVNSSRDPRQCKNVRQHSVVDNVYQTVTNDKGNSLNENGDRFLSEQALTQASFVEPSNNLLVQDMSTPEQELKLDIVKKYSDLSAPSRDSHSVATLSATTPQSACELEESTQSSSNEKNQHSDSRRQRHTFKADSQSSPRRRSRHDRKPQHEERSSRVSRDEADRYRRRGRHSPERSRRSRSRSHDRGRRQERVSSSQRDHHRHRSTSRHRTRRDQHLSRGRSTQSRSSDKPETDKSCQKDQSPSRQRRESVEHSTELAQKTKQEASGPAEVKVEEFQNRVSENGEQNVSELHEETKNDQPSNRGQTSTDLHDQFPQREQQQLTADLHQGDLSHPIQGDHSNKDFKIWNENLDEPEGPKDHFAQRDHAKLPPQKDRNTCSNNQTDPDPQSYVHIDGPLQSNENKQHTPWENPSQRDDFLQDETERFNRRIQPQFEHSSPPQSEADQFRDPRGNVPHSEAVISGQRDEQSFGSLQSKKGHSLYHETDPRRQPSQRVHQSHREGSLEHEQPYSRRKLLSGTPDLERSQLPQRVPQTQREGSLEHEQLHSRSKLLSELPDFQRRQLLQRMPQTRREGSLEHEQRYPRSKLLSGPPDMPSGHFSNSGPDLCFNKEALGKHPSQVNRSNLPPDEALQISHDNYPKRIPTPSYKEASDFLSPGTDEVCHNVERYSGSFPLEEKKSGHQQGLQYRPVHFQENSFLLPEAENTNFKNNQHQMPSNRRRGSFQEDGVDQLHPPDHTPADFSQGERDMHREDLYFREQFRPRGPGDHWKGPSPRAHGPRGPPLGALMTPRGPTAIRPRMPRAPNPERLENSAPGLNFGQRGPYPRPRMVGDSGASPNIGPRGPPSRPGMFQDSETLTNKNIQPRGPSPISHMSEEDSFQDSGFKSQVPEPGMSESRRPPMFRHRGPSSGPRMFEGPRPGPSHFQRIMGGPRGLCQPRHKVLRSLLDIGDSKLSYVNEPRGHAAPHQFDKGPFESHLPDGRRHAPFNQCDKESFDNRNCDSDRPFDEAQSQGSDESNYKNSANESPQNQRNPLGRWSRGQPRIPMCRSPSFNQPEVPQFPGMDSGMRGLHQFDEFGEQETEEEMDFEKPDIYEGDINHEDHPQTKSHRFNLSRSFGHQRVPAPLFSGMRMPAPRNKESNPYSPCFSSKNAPTSAHSQRLLGPKVDKIPKLLPCTRPRMMRPQMVRPQMRFVGPPKEPDVRPLRLSGPLLPTPPGGRVRMHNPRMQRSFAENSPIIRELNRRMIPPHTDDPQTESSQNLIHERPDREPVNEGEESTSQDSSPIKFGKRWRRRPRNREVRKKAARKQRSTDRRKSGGKMVRDRNTDNSQKRN